MLQYPVFQYVVPDNSLDSNCLLPNRARENLRVVKLRHVFRFILRIAALQGEIVAPTRGIEAIAIWTRSDKARLSVTGALRAGFLALPIEVGLQTTRRLLKLVKQKQAQRRKLLEGQYHLLDMLGVDPGLQGKGYGRVLIEAKLDELDHTHEQCYLETSDVRNIEYYRRHGFDLVHEHSIETLPVYCLLRPGR
jgi:ribosomal protein S18 acetylase RimI-like enzyme